MLDERFGAPLRPPAAWFSLPAWLEPGQRLTIIDHGEERGRFAGYFWSRGTCHPQMSTRGSCWEPPSSPSGYAAFHQGHVITAEGLTIVAGTLGRGHAPASMATLDAMAFYNEPDRGEAVGVAGENEHGFWVAGALLPHVTEEDVAMMRRCSLSGDWRWYHHHPLSRDYPWPAQGQYDCLGPCFVNRPALPQPVAAAVSSEPPSAAWGDDPPAFIGTNIGVQSGAVPEPSDSTSREEPAMGPQTILAAVIGATDLPVTDDREWDGDAADLTVREWASSDGSGDPETIDWGRYSQAFFWRDDDADPETFGAYGFGFAEVIDGELTAIGNGCRAVMSRLPQSNVPADDQERIAARADAYLERIREMMDEEEGEEGMMSTAPRLEAVIAAHSEARPLRSSPLAVYNLGEGWRVRFGRREFAAPSRADAFRAATRIALPVLAAVEGDGPRFRMDPLLIEGEWTRDARLIEEAWWDEARLPLSVFAQTILGEWGHEGAFLVGRIDSLTRAENRILAEGVFGGWDEALDAAQRVADGFLTGVSLDPGEVEDVKIEIPLLTEEQMDELDEGSDDEGDTLIIEDEPVRVRFGRVEVAGATIVAHPAFGDAQIELLEQPAEPDPALASLQRDVGFLVQKELERERARLGAPGLPPSAALAAAAEAQRRRG